MAIDTYKDNGRIFAAGHDMPFNWLGPNTSISNDATRQLKLDFIDNIVYWLSKGSPINNNKHIIAWQNLIDSNKPFDNFKIIKINQRANISEEDEEKLLNFLENGGGLFCAATIWGILQKIETLEQVDIHRFLRKHTGILFTKEIAKCEPLTKLNPSKMSDQILFDLEKIPCEPNSGILIVSGKSEAVYAHEKSSNIILAAAKHQKGRILVSTHHNNHQWLKNPSNETKENFSKNIINWLTRYADISNDEIIQLNAIPDSVDGGLNNYKIIQLNGKETIDELTQDDLLDYLQNGGAIFCAITFRSKKTDL
jgi:hypothetical protein